MQVPAIQGWGEAMMTSIAAALALLMAAVPKVIGFLLILLVGWFIAGLIAKAVGAILRNVRFNDFARRSSLGKTRRPNGRSNRSRRRARCHRQMVCPTSRADRRLRRIGPARGVAGVEPTTTVDA